MSKDDIEQMLGQYLGIEKVIWLPRGVYADFYTNGHVDNFCCFVRPGAVLLAWTDDRNDPQVYLQCSYLSVMYRKTAQYQSSLQITVLGCCA